MKLLHYIIFIIKIENVEPYFIKNQNKPICANCKYLFQTKMNVVILHILMKQLNKKNYMHKIK